MTMPRMHRDGKRARLQQQRAEACFYKRHGDLDRPSKTDLNNMLSDAVKNTAAQQTTERNDGKA